MKKLFNYLSLAVLCTFVAVSCGPDEPEVDTSLNCRTHELTFFTSIKPSLHVSLNCR